MTAFSWTRQVLPAHEQGRTSRPSLRQEISRRQITGAVIIALSVYQLLQLPGALISHSIANLGTVLLGLLLCGAAALFNQLGKVVVVGILLMLVIDVGCGLMLLTSPMGLDVGGLPVFDALLICNLIAVTFLPAWSVFPVALGNIIFILGDIALQPHTAMMSMMLSSTMAYDMVMQPVELQIVVAVVAYILVVSATRAIRRADRAEEVATLQRREAELQRREAEQKQQLEQGIEQLSQTLIRAANGERTAPPTLSQDHLLWRVGSSLNLLLTRFWRANQAEQRARHAEQENQRLRGEVFA